MQDRYIGPVHSAKQTLSVIARAVSFLLAVHCAARVTILGVLRPWTPFHPRLPLSTPS